MNTETPLRRALLPSPLEKTPPASNRKRALGEVSLNVPQRPLSAQAYTTPEHAGILGKLRKSSEPFAVPQSLPLHNKMIRQTPPDSTHKSSEEEDAVWGPDIENAFMEAIRHIPKLGRRKIQIGSKPCGRNELIADYIFRRTGKVRSRKQVSSHIQVLKHIRRDDHEFLSLVADTSKDNDTSPYGFDSRMASTYDVMAAHQAAEDPMSGYAHPTQVLARGPSTSEPRFADFCVWATRNAGPNATEEIAHVYTKYAGSVDSYTPLDAVADWPFKFPCLSEMIADAQGVRCGVFFIQSSLHLPHQLDLTGQSQIVLRTQLAMLRPQSALQAAWGCTTRIYTMGNKVLELKQRVPLDSPSGLAGGAASAAGRTSVPFATDFWAAFLAGLSHIDSENRDRDVRNALDGITVVQEIFAIDGPETHRECVLLWEFDKADGGPGRTVARPIAIQDRTTSWVLQQHSGGASGAEQQHQQPPQQQQQVQMPGMQQQLSNSSGRARVAPMLQRSRSMMASYAPYPVTSAERAAVSQSARRDQRIASDPTTMAGQGLSWQQQAQLQRGQHNNPTATPTPQYGSLPMAAQQSMQSELSNAGFDSVSDVYYDLATSGYGHAHAGGQPSSAETMRYVDMPYASAGAGLVNPTAGAAHHLRHMTAMQRSTSMPSWNTMAAGGMDDFAVPTSASAVAAATAATSAGADDWDMSLGHVPEWAAGFDPYASLAGSGAHAAAGDIFSTHPHAAALDLAHVDLPAPQPIVVVPQRPATTVPYSAAKASSALGRPKAAAGMSTFSIIPSNPAFATNPAGKGDNAAAAPKRRGRPAKLRPTTSDGVFHTTSARDVGGALTPVSAGLRHPMDFALSAASPAASSAAAAAAAAAAGGKAGSAGTSAGSASTNSTSASSSAAAAAAAAAATAAQGGAKKGKKNHGHGVVTPPPSASLTAASSLVGASTNSAPNANASAGASAGAGAGVGGASEDEAMPRLGFFAL